MSDTKTATGGCLCGAVKYQINGPRGDIVACHCGQCRRQGGHFWASTSARRADLALTEERGLKWYQSSPQARRGFCGECGSNLFWEGEGMDDVFILAGSLDKPTGLRLASHIFVADKGDYYDIDDDLPRFAGYDTPISQGAS
jgi:hypothetical protein